MIVDIDLFLVVLIFIAWFLYVTVLMVSSKEEECTDKESIVYDTKNDIPSIDFFNNDNTKGCIKLDSLDLSGVIPLFV